MSKKKMNVLRSVLTLVAVLAIGCMMGSCGKEKKNEAGARSMKEEITELVDQQNEDLKLLRMLMEVMEKGEHGDIMEEEEEDVTIETGIVAPDFTLKDLEGKQLTLSSLRGKYVVLDFWGSWCGWCIKGFPDMKIYYEKYKDKMEIVGMDCDDSVEAWKHAVAKYKLPWKQVYVPYDSRVPADYLISNFPTKVIIDPEGKVVTVVIGEKDSFYEKLDELFGK